MQVVGADGHDVLAPLVAAFPGGAYDDGVPARITRGWQTVRDRYAKKYESAEKMGRLTFSDLTIMPLGENAAMVLGSWSLERKEDRPHGKFTLLVRKFPEGWRIVLDHTS